MIRITRMSKNGGLLGSDLVIPDRLDPLIFRLLEQKDNQSVTIEKQFTRVRFEMVKEPAKEKAHNG